MVWPFAHVLDGAIAGDGGHGGVADAPGRGGGGAAHLHLEGLSGLQGEVRPVEGQGLPEAPEPLPLEEDAPEVTEL